MGRGPTQPSSLLCKQWGCGLFWKQCVYLKKKKKAHFLHELSKSPINFTGSSSEHHCSEVGKVQTRSAERSSSSISSFLCDSVESLLVLSAYFFFVIIWGDLSVGMRVGGLGGGGRGNVWVFLLSLLWLAPSHPHPPPPFLREGM